MAMLSLRMFTLPMLLVAALSIRLTLSRESTRSSSSRRETSESDDTYVGRTNRAEALKIVCEKTQQNIFNQYGEDQEAGIGIWSEEDLSDFVEQLQPKPIMTPKFSVCSGLETTCCNLQAEKTIEKIVRKEYRLLYHDMLKAEYFKFCPYIGKTLYREMQANLREVRRVLEIEANTAAEMELPNDMFNELFTFLINFSIHPDICPIPSVVASQIEKIVETIFMSFIDDDDVSIFGNITSPEEQKMCLLNATRSFTESDANSLTNFLGRLLYDYREFVQSVYLAERVIEQVKLHTFPPSCLSALSRMKYCAWCGGYTGHPPCLNLCLNTFRGCFSDVAEVHSDYKTLLKLLREQAVDVVPNLKVEAMRDGLANFIYLIRSMVTRERELKATVTAFCGKPQADDNDNDDLDELDSLRGRRRRQTFYQPINPAEEQSHMLHVPSEDQLGFDPLSQAFTEELRCLDLFEELMITVPDQLCFLRKDKVSTSTNVNCWTGSFLATKERYEESLVGPRKSEQFNNSAFELHPVESGILYSDLIYKLQERINKLNQTIEENEQCRNSDDEDQCARNLFHSCTAPKPICGPGDCHSGSGSGSGSGSDSSSQDDTESGPTEFSFEEHTTSNAGDTNTNANANNNRQTVITKNTGFSNHFNDAPSRGHIPFVQKADTIPTTSYAEVIMNIAPDEEEEEDTDIDATPTQTRVPWQENTDTVNGEKPKHLVDGRSGTHGQYFMLPAMVTVIIWASVLAIITY